MNGILAYIVGVLVFLVGIGLSIGLHEIGHLVPAKLFGARVAKYMIGFGPTLWSKKKGDTEYGIKLLPLGGYISIAGMFPPGQTHPGNKLGASTWLRRWVESARRQQIAQDGYYDEAKAFHRLSIPRRITIMLGGPVMNLILGTLLILISLSGIGGYQASNRIEKVFPCVTTSYTSTNCVAGDPSSPASLAGLRAGDVVEAVNGQAITVWAPVQKLLQAKTETLNLQVLRQGKLISVVVKPTLEPRPVVDEMTGQAVKNSDGTLRVRQRGVLGIQLAYERAPYSVAYSMSYVGMALGQTASLVGTLPAQISNLAVTTFTGGKRSVAGPVSVVGVGNISGTIAENNNLDIPGKIAVWLMILGSLNFALFIFNLVPLLPLDGGHVLSALLELVKRGYYKLFKRIDPGPLDTAKFIPFTMVMWVVLMGMSVLVVFADIINPVSLG